MWTHDSKLLLRNIANFKAHYALLQVLNDDDISRIINCTCAHDTWQVLITTHEGTSQVKKAKIDA